ncbi:MAG: Lrp/AsnC ligand binding domain-containing protein [Candidatus Woesearchaeota archaeon]
MLAYVLISLKKQAEAEVFDRLKDMKEIKVVHMLYGEWDFIVKIDAPNIESITTFTIEKLRSMPEVEMTSTLIVAK